MLQNDVCPYKKSPMEGTRFLGFPVSGMISFVLYTSGGVSKVKMASASASSQLFPKDASGIKKVRW